MSDYLGDFLGEMLFYWTKDKGGDITIYNDLCYSLSLNEKKKDITFSSPICVRISQSLNLNSNQLAKEIVDIYEQNKSIYSSNLIIINANNGWLELTLTKYFLSRYLVNLSQYCLNNDYLNIAKKHAYFKYIYIYCRICSLLRSAHEQRIIQLNNLDFCLNKWNVIDLENNIFTNLIYTNNRDLALIKNMIYCLEVTFKKSNKVNYFSVLDKMYQGLVHWEKNCRIWGQVKQENISLARARLGLGAIALRYYQNLCKSVFIEEFPTEL
ncbi:hypothetical protein IQ215_11970 [Cyanobacterium stanieri LEGE 03274]|uniref:DALR anticodon binding domain-containing protein n=1 Tax=Cyanobacterium stanieri LEGE 03274 TaxID=1828756 RepID=A0ABR9V986_9CHRO|nr:hypothetical protein [Cyanobacterium stanieri]MBE9223414.1 hypothetical protein [Cyanobacterium stanieri LEGE 03274]